MVSKSDFWLCPFPDINKGTFDSSSISRARRRNNRNKSQRRMRGRKLR